MKRRIQWGMGLLTAVWVLVLPGCGQYEQIRVPEQKAGFIGRWSEGSEGSDFFELEPDGNVNLEIQGPTESFLIRKGSLRSFEAESVCVGAGERQQGDCLSISTNPYTSGGREVILVEGVELARE